MKITKKQLAMAIASILILVISLAVMILDFVLPLELWTHPVLTFVFCCSIGFFILNIILGFSSKSVWNLFISAILAAFAIIYPFAHYDFWWIGLIVLVVVWAIIGVSSFMLTGSKTESIALNAREDYKDYKERKALDKENKKVDEELPEIKSFK